MLIFLVLAIAAVFAVIQWRANTREAAANADYPPTGQLVDVDGTIIHAHVTGEGLDVVLIHGAGGNVRDFTFDLVGRLGDRYRVITFDRPGLGHSDRLPGKGGAWNSDFESPQEQAAMLQKAAEQIGVSNPIVLGHSYGGTVALAWALSRPEGTAAVVLAGAVSEP